MFINNFMKLLRTSLTQLVMFTIIVFIARYLAAQVPPTD